MRTLVDDKQAALAGSKVARAQAPLPTPHHDHPSPAVASRGEVDRTLALAVLAVALATVLGVMAQGAGHVLSADDLGLQRLVDIWRHDGHGTAWISEDLFLSRWPLYFLFDVVGLTGRAGVLVASALCNATAAVAVVLGVAFSGCVRRPLQARTALALVLVVTFSASFWSTTLFIPNSRALELGLGLLVVGWLADSSRVSRLSPAARLGVGACFTFLWLSDPFTLYLVGGIVVVLAAFELRDPATRPGARILLLLVGVSALVSRVARLVLTFVGVEAEPLTGRVLVRDLDGLVHRARLVGTELLTVLGVRGSALTGGKADQVVLAWCRVGLVLAGLTGLVLVVRNWKAGALPGPCAGGRRDHQPARAPARGLLRRPAGAHHPLSRPRADRPRGARCDRRRSRARPLRTAGSGCPRGCGRGRRTRRQRQPLVERAW